MDFTVNMILLTSENWTNKAPCGHHKPRAILSVPPLLTASGTCLQQTVQNQRYRTVTFLPTTFDWKITSATNVLIMHLCYGMHTCTHLPLEPGGRANNVNNPLPLPPQKSTQKATTFMLVLHKLKPQHPFVKLLLFSICCSSLEEPYVITNMLNETNDNGPLTPK